MIVLWIFLLVAVYYIFKDRIPTDSEGRRTSSADETLKQRYVNGDIGEETYRRMKKEISK